MSDGGVFWFAVILLAIVMTVGWFSCDAGQSVERATFQDCYARLQQGDTLAVVLRDKGCAFYVETMRNDRDSH